MREAPHIMVVGLGFGDEGKGATIAKLAETFDFTRVIRFNGGAQAAHNVVLPDGRHHTFSQFGSGTLQGLTTYLSRYVLVDPLRLAAEADHLEEIGVDNPYSLMTVDSECLVITPYHALANKSDEDWRKALGIPHGSCGVGIGKTMEYHLETGLGLKVKHLSDPAMVRRLLLNLEDHYRDGLLATGPEIDEIDHDALVDAYSSFIRAVNVKTDAHIEYLQNERCLLEGAQGVLLDEHYGFHPHTTWSTTTPQNAIALLDEAGREALCFGVTRTYHTRHGAGPFPTENDALAAFLGEEHNKKGVYQGDWRVGDFDAVLLKYALAVCQRFTKVDGIVLTHADKVGLKSPIKMVGRYNDDGMEITSMIPPGEKMRGRFDYQTRLTNRLAQVDPESFARFAETIDFYADYMCGVPIYMYGRGPTTADYEFNPRFPGIEEVIWRNGYALTA